MTDPTTPSASSTPSTSTASSSPAPPRSPGSPSSPPSDARPDRSRPLEELHPNERIKLESAGLRGTLMESLEDRTTGGLRAHDHELTKFHGIYRQDAREEREERRRRKLEPAWEFMIRVRLPGGVCRPDQWLVMDELARSRANGTLRLTTRQTFQLHGVLKGDLRPALQGLHRVLLDTVGACGDVNRGVMATSLPELDPLHGAVFPLARAVSEELLPRSRAYHEIWIDGERSPLPGAEGAGGEEAPGTEEEPIYGPTFLPRKFKVGFAIPPVNDVDVFTQDLGFIAIGRGDALEGFNLVVGGGMGRTDGDPRTYARLGDVLGFLPPERTVEVARTVVEIQRDFGNRVDRKLSRFKYTIDRLGLAWFREELERRLGWTLGPVRPYRFLTSQDRFGWTRNQDGSWNYTLFVENGRVADREGRPLLTGLRSLAELHLGEFRVTANQNLIVARVPEEERPRVEAALAEHGLSEGNQRSPIRLHSMACVALPTCPLAMAEAERYFPSFLDRIDALAREAGIEEAPVVMRMSGCPNGCSRPYVAEVGLSGRGPGRYALYLGGGFHGERLATPVLENADESEILSTLGPLFRRYGVEGGEGERFGDFLHRVGVVGPPA